jgi:phage virion morphogenesis protein
MILIEIDDREVMEALKRLEATGADMSGAMADIATALSSESERQFQREAGPTGPWPDLADSTKRRRAASGHWPGQKLRVSGILAGSVQPGYNSRSAWIGTNQPYSTIHQFGGMAGRGRKVRIPARPYLPLHPETKEMSPEARTTIMEILQGHLQRALGG